MALIKTHFRLLCAVITFMLTGIAAAGAADAPAISGMALIEGTTSFLVVHDSKSGQAMPAAGILSYSEGGGMSYSPLAVDWPVRPANDLESIYGMHTRPGEFVLCESGSWSDRATGELHPGRLFHARLDGSAGSWSLTVLRSMDIPAQLHEIEGICMYQHQPSTFELLGQENKDIQMRLQARLSEEAGDEAGATNGDLAEIMPVQEPRPKQVVVFGTRGGGYPYEPGALHRHEINLEEGVITESPLQDPQQIGASRGLGSPWARSITDLYLDRNGVLWISSATDVGDTGPFESMVQRYGQFTAEENYYYGSGTYYSSANVMWSISGVKIEAIGAPFTQGSVLSYGTDDEAFGGIIRPLGPGGDNPYWY